MSEFWYWIVYEEGYIAWVGFWLLFMIAIDEYTWSRRP